jgi:DNA-directed RNA polymerase specialized sigma24 family protein
MSTSPDPTCDDAFPSTHWSLVARAGRDNDTAPDALSKLCSQYWYPIYAFFRRRSTSVPEAEDLTQGFFAHLLDGDLVAEAKPAVGRFRGYLIACCRHYLVDQHRRQGAVKRGVSARRVSIDFAEAERRYRREPADGGDPDRLFVRNWAFALIEQAEQSVRAEYVLADRGTLFDRLRPALVGDPNSERYRVIGREFGLTPNAVKMVAQQMRERYAAELRRCIAQTVARPEDLEEEIRELFVAVAGKS